MITILKKKIWGSILYDITNKPYWEHTIYFNDKHVILPITWPDDITITIKAPKKTNKYYIDDVEIEKDERNKQYNKTKDQYFQYDEDSEYDIPITIHSKKERDIIKEKFITTSIDDIVDLEYKLVELDYWQSEYEFIKPLAKIWDIEWLYEFRGIKCANYIFKTICDKYDMKYSTSSYDFYQHKPMHRSIEWKSLVSWTISRDYAVQESVVDTYESCVKRYKEIENVLKPVIINTIASLSKTVASAKTLWKIVDMVNEINITIYWWWKKDCSDRSYNKEKLTTLKKYIADIVLNDTV